MVVIQNKATNKVYFNYQVGTKDEEKFFRVNVEGEKYFFESKEEYLNWSVDRHLGKDKATMIDFILNTTDTTNTTNTTNTTDTV